MTDERQNVQVAPYPVILEDLVNRCSYRPGWTVELHDDETRDTGSAVQSHGMTLSITTKGYNSYHPERGQGYGVIHSFPVPPATYNEGSWTRWLFEQFLLVERHEAMEFFAFRQPCVDSESDRSRGCAGWDGNDEHHENCPLRGKNERPYAPNHGPGNDPYIVHDLATDLERRTRFTGTVNNAAR